MASARSVPHQRKSAPTLTVGLQLHPVSKRTSSPSSARFMACRAACILAFQSAFAFCLRVCLLVCKFTRLSTCLYVCVKYVRICMSVCALRVCCVCLLVCLFVFLLVRPCVGQCMCVCICSQQRSNSSVQAPSAATRMLTVRHGVKTVNMLKVDMWPLFCCSRF